MSSKHSKVRKSPTTRKERFIRDVKKAMRAILVLFLSMVVLVGAASMVGPEPVGQDSPNSEMETKQVPEDIPDESNLYTYTDDAINMIQSRVYNSPAPDDIQEESQPSEPVEEIPEPEPELTPVEYTETERTMMQYCVELEAHGASLKHKQIIACVIVNRLYSEDFNYDTLEEVLTAENQFSGMDNYYNKYYEPDQDTIDAVDGVLSGEIDRDELSMGATFFYNPDRVGRRLSSFENRTFLFPLEGHRFFK